MAPEVAIAHQVVLLGRKLDRVAEVCLSFGMLMRTLVIRKVYQMS